MRIDGSVSSGPRRVTPVAVLRPGRVRGRGEGRGARLVVVLTLARRHVRLAKIDARREIIVGTTTQLAPCNRGLPTAGKWRPVVVFEHGGG